MACELKQLVIMAAGKQSLRLNYAGGSNSLLNVNWLKFSSQNDTGGGNPSDDGGTGSNAGVECEFIIANQWESGFVAEVKITNNGSTPVAGNWSVGFQFTDGSRFLTGWNGTFSGNNPIDIAPLSWNSTIAAGSSVVFGVQTDKGSAGLPAPTPVVNGSVCG